jgi:hypothetical protein
MTDSCVRFREAKTKREHRTGLAGVPLGLTFGRDYYFNRPAQLQEGASEIRQDR